MSEKCILQCAKGIRDRISEDFEEFMTIRDRENRRWKYTGVRPAVAVRWAWLGELAVRGVVGTACHHNLGRKRANQQRGIFHTRIYEF